MNTLLVSLLIGGGLGALLGRLSRCNTGACPLTANWERGALYGAVLGLAFHFASGGATGPYEPPRNVKPVATADFDAEVAHAGPVVVDFFATWCGPCKAFSPELDKLAGEFAGKIKFMSVNVDQAPSLTSRFNVHGIPTLLFFGKDGKIRETSIGRVSVEGLRAKLAALASK